MVGGKYSPPLWCGRMEVSFTGKHTREIKLFTRRTFTPSPCNNKTKNILAKVLSFGHKNVGCADFDV
jgi:hypothetical protein